MTVDLAKAQADHLRGLPGSADPGWLKALRQKALGCFQELGFPGTRGERWRYTDLSVLMPEGLSPAPTGPLGPSGALQELAAQGWETSRGAWLTFVDGLYSPGDSKPASGPGWEAASLASRLRDPRVEAHLGRTASFDRDAMTSLSLAAFRDGAFVALEPGAAPAEPLHLVFVSKGPVHAWTRNLLLAGEGGRLTVVEHFLEQGTSPSWMGSVTEARLGGDARLSHLKVQHASRKNLHWGRVAARQEAGSAFTSRVFSFGGRMARSETETLLAGKRAEARMDGLFLVAQGQHADLQTFIDHSVPQCSCQEAYRGVVDGDGVGVFDGKVLVRENAQKTDARQSNKNLLLSKQAKVHSKPQLQIYADDVKCSHGSATGQLDEEALFYLRARGIGRREARQLLVEAFASELVDRVEEAGLREPLARAFQGWFRTGEAAHGD